MTAAEPVKDAEVDHLFADLAAVPAIVLAVSGGPDSTALLVLAARWRQRMRRGPQLIAVTVDHGLRQEAGREAAAVKRLARELGVAHRTVRWTETKPANGLQAKARVARYRLLVREARRCGASHVLTAHTRDDQAETVLFRLARGSGLTGLAAMARVTPLGHAWLIRPFLDLPKARLVATLSACKIAFADDPSNRDPRYTRVRWRTLMPQLAGEGLDAERLGTLASRMRRANAAIDALVDAVAQRTQVTQSGASIVVDLALFAQLPEEVALRLIGRAIAAVGNEGAAELGKLEALVTALRAAVLGGARLRRTLAGAMITVLPDQIAVERAPARRNPPKLQAKGRRRAEKVPFTNGR